MAEITNFKGETAATSAKSMADESVATLIRRVGERVRNARERKGVSRRILSEMSGVSPRYLAQLEFGEGNISIGLLQRVANALDHRIEWLVGEDDPWTSDLLQASDLFRAANAETRAAALRILSQNERENVRAHRISLTGMRGAGKSTLGALAGQALGIPFVELNREIEEQSGMPISEVMALYGSEGYRRLENQAITRIIETHETMILAVAGGIVGAPDTYNRLLSHFHTIWIRSSPREHMDRVRAQGDERPMKGYPEAMEHLTTLLHSREVLYDRALATVDTSGKPVETSLQDLLEIIHARGFLGG